MNSIDSCNKVASSEAPGFDVSDSDTSGSNLTHLDASGQAQMVDVSAKQVSVRQAIASGTITMSPETLAAI